MIPKIIHQIWLGKKRMPVKWLTTWLKYHPDFEFYFWSNHSIRYFKFANMELIESFLDKEIYHGAADIIRYEILFEFGGFVAPADSECLLSIEPLLKESDCFACYENEIVRPGLVSPHLGCIPGHPLMKELIKRLSKITEPKRGWRTEDPWQVTGNELLTKTIKEFRTDARVLNLQMIIYPSHYFIPEHYEGIKSEKKPNYAKHHWYTTKGN